VLSNSNTRLIFEYEQKLSHFTQINTKLNNQLKNYLAEMMNLARKAKDTDRLDQLKENDRVLSQYQLEGECRQNVFDWIRDEKDLEIREEFKT
jgi:hypothetical protein